MHIVSDSESERSRKISGRENEWGQGRADAPDFWKKCSLRAFCSILAALPGAPAPGKARRPQSKYTTWLVETENSEAPSYSKIL